MTAVDSDWLLMNLNLKPQIYTTNKYEINLNVYYFILVGYSFKSITDWPLLSYKKKLKIIIIRHLFTISLWQVNFTSDYRMKKEYFLILTTVFWRRK